MSSPPVSRERPLYQPFQCVICQRRFTRHENLKRHATLHSRFPGEASLPCPFCQATFSRSDLRHRHVRRKHPEQEPKSPTKRQRYNGPRQPDSAESHADKLSALLPDTSKIPLQVHKSSGTGVFSIDKGAWEASGNTEYRSSQDSHASVEQNTTLDSIFCGGGSSPEDYARSMSGEPYSSHPLFPNSDNVQPNLVLASSLPDRQMQSELSNIDLPGLDLVVDVNHESPRRLSADDLTHSQSAWSPSSRQISRGCHLFFTHVSPFLPFLHKATFDPYQSCPLLLLGILSLGYQYGEDPDLGDKPATGSQLSKICFYEARTLITPHQCESTDSFRNITMVQSYLLLQVCSMMYLCGQDSVYGLKIHSTMIALARKSGLMQPVSMGPVTSSNLESLWHGFIKAESHKRTIFAVHQMDALWYQCLSIPRSISHLEVKHGLPCPIDQWLASSAAEWAHCQLVTGNVNSPVQYADAVRRFLSPDIGLQSMPQFDPYGTVNIAQFLISSGREISGWSTMTGMLSIERFGALRSSLAALGPFSRSKPEEPYEGHMALCEATWETAMIEIQLWSPSHTGGIVEESIDAVLTQSTYLSPSCDLLCDVDNAAIIQPHVDWFLRYLDAALPDSEAPWVVLYAYKNLLVAWQLLRGGLSGAMSVIRILDGDLEGALKWAKTVFRQRERWQIGKLILACLEDLSK